MRAFAITTALMLLLAAVAAAAVRNGIYSAGSSKGTGVSIKVRGGKFTVQRIKFTEHCEAGDRSFDQPIEFVSGSKASISGPIKANGEFSGRYSATGTVFIVEGRFRGDHARVVGRERGTYEDDSGDTVRCRGSRRFKARRLEITGGT